MSKFRIKGKSYTLTFGMSAMKAYQRESKETALEAFEALESAPGDMIRLSGLFRAACRPAVTEDEADSLIDALGLGKTIRLIGEAVQDASKEIAVPNLEAPSE